MMLQPSLQQQQHLKSRFLRRGSRVTAHSTRSLTRRLSLSNRKMFALHYVISIFFIIISLIICKCSADKDPNYYPFGQNPNTKFKMYWKDSRNVLQDLSQFHSLYIKYHGCVWSECSVDQNDDDGENHDGDSTWYQTRTQTFCANAAYTLYGYLNKNAEQHHVWDNFKRMSIHHCTRSTYINSFFTYGGADTLVNALGLERIQTSLSMYNDDDNGYSYNPNAKCYGDGNHNSHSGDNKNNNNNNYGSTSSTMGCSDEHKFVVAEFQGDYCNGNYYVDTTDELTDYNDQMDNVRCYQIYVNNKNSNSDRERQLEDRASSNYGSAAEMLLKYSWACDIDLYPNGQCPDPYGLKKKYETIFDLVSQGHQPGSFAIVSVYMRVPLAIMSWMALLGGSYLVFNAYRRQKKSTIDANGGGCSGFMKTWLMDLKLSVKKFIRSLRRCCHNTRVYYISTLRSLRKKRKRMRKKEKQEQKERKSKSTSGRGRSKTKKRDQDDDSHGDGLFTGGTRSDTRSKSRNRSSDNDGEYSDSMYRPSSPSSNRYRSDGSSPEGRKNRRKGSRSSRSNRSKSPSANEDDYDDDAYYNLTPRRSSRSSGLYDNEVDHSHRPPASPSRQQQWSPKRRIEERKKKSGYSSGSDIEAAANYNQMNERHQKHHRGLKGYFTNNGSEKDEYDLPSYTPPVAQPSMTAPSLGFPDVAMSNMQQMNEVIDDTAQASFDEPPRPENTPAQKHQRLVKSMFANMQKLKEKHKSTASPRRARDDNPNNGVEIDEFGQPRSPVYGDGGASSGSVARSNSTDNMPVGSLSHAVPTGAQALKQPSSRYRSDRDGFIYESKSKDESLRHDSPHRSKSPRPASMNASPARHGRSEMFNRAATNRSDEEIVDYLATRPLQADDNMFSQNLSAAVIDGDRNSITRPPIPPPPRALSAGRFRKRVPYDRPLSAGRAQNRAPDLFDNPQSLTFTAGGSAGSNVRPVAYDGMDADGIYNKVSSTFAQGEYYAVVASNSSGSAPRGIARQLSDGNGKKESEEDGRRSMLL